MLVQKYQTIICYKHQQRSKEVNL